jgi:hypothetical protein
MMIEIIPSQGSILPEPCRLSTKTDYYEATIHQHTSNNPTAGGWIIYLYIAALQSA